MANKHEKQRDFYERMREWRKGTQSNDNIINRKVSVGFDYELDPNGPKSYYDEDKDCFRRPKTIDPDLEPDSQFDL